MWNTETLHEVRSNEYLTGIRTYIYIEREVVEKEKMTEREGLSNRSKKVALVTVLVGLKIKQRVRPGSYFNFPSLPECQQ